MRSGKKWWLVAVVFAVSASLAQSQQSATPTVAFTCDFPGSDPSHYAISLSSDGHASYTSDGKLTRDSEASEPFSFEFAMPQPTLTHIFDLTKKAHYFEGEIDSKKKNIASTGEKSLSYADGQRKTSAKYNYSPIPAVAELTSVFQNLAITLEFGRRLEFDHRYQKLAINEELEHMSDISSRNELGDVAVIAATLKKIIDDPSVVNTARARAQRLLDRAGAAK
ncbi:MAG: hypothetical protein JOZ80_00935 [Acidobacteriaceae bacterium]|nr:hypothetical protein [Acidobacteriaceae bacterium]